MAVLALQFEFQFLLHVDDVIFSIVAIDFLRQTYTQLLHINHPTSMLVICYLLTKLSTLLIIYFFSSRYDSPNLNSSSILSILVSLTLSMASTSVSLGIFFRSELRCYAEWAILWRWAQMKVQFRSKGKWLRMISILNSTHYLDVNQVVPANPYINLYCTFLKQTNT